MVVNPFYQRASDRQLARGIFGGQHASSDADHWRLRRNPPMAQRTEQDDFYRRYQAARWAETMATEPKEFAVVEGDGTPESVPF